MSGGEVIPGLWRFEAMHPEWTEEEGGEDGSEPNVAWWAVAADAGLVLVDPLVFDWASLDTLVERHGACAGVARTCHWHERSVPLAADRFGVHVYSRLAWPGAVPWRVDRVVSGGEEMIGGIRAIDVERDDEMALWLPSQRALLFGDAMLRDPGSGELRICPESWTQPPGGRARLRAILTSLLDLPVEHVLVSHGPLVLGDGAAALRAATSAA